MSWSSVRGNGRYNPPIGNNTPLSPSPSPNHGELFRDRGIELSEAGDYDGAIPMYDTALSYEHSDVTTLLYRSFAHTLRRTPDLEKALQDAEQAVQIDQTKWKAWKQKGEILRSQGNIPEAIGALTKAADLASGLDRLELQRLLQSVKHVSPVNPASTQQTPSPPSPPEGSGTGPPPSTSTTAPDRTTTSQPQQAAPNNTSNHVSTQPNASKPPSRTQNVNQFGNQNRQPSTARSQSLQNINSVSDPQSPTPQISTQANTEPAPLQQSNQPQVTRNFNVETVNQSTTPTVLPFSGEDLINSAQPNEPPPSYSQGTSISITEANRRSTELNLALAAQNKGCIGIRPYTTSDGIDVVQLIYEGMTQAELTTREIGKPIFLHDKFKSMVVSSYNIPGTNWLDLDPESSEHYEGKLGGTVAIQGYSEEYRTYQLIKRPLVKLALEASSGFKEVDLEKIVTHARLIQSLPTTENDEALKKLLNLSSTESLNRSLYDHPTRFLDFSKSRTLTQHVLGTEDQDIGCKSFLFQIVIGAELLIRMRKQPVNISYQGIVTDNISALLVASAAWMKSVTITGPRQQGLRYLFAAQEHRRNSEALIRFAECMQWPYMDEARNYMEDAYINLGSAKEAISLDICDWLYGLILPGKFFRHRILCCLVFASCSSRALKGAPFYDNGLIVADKSYWPKITVLGRVLGGFHSCKSICGWVGPLPKPAGNVSGWVRLISRSVDVPVPVSRKNDILVTFGFDPNSEDSSNIVESITNVNNWAAADPPSIPPNDSSQSVLKSIELALNAPGPDSPLVDTDLPQEQYRASLKFLVNGVSVTYTLYSNPIFVSAPPCVGTHPLHKRTAQKYHQNTVRVPDLKNHYPIPNELLVINALGKNEETGVVMLALRHWHHVKRD
ncbi:uncharacterized protein KY384_000857 [Bacidia gigantensis]|uniref:uncharacterized protein n=1 Tax=Bacidia gigantensis TaxID=2732470 RepID=UPI001D04EF16|nr:uncharacterized protein KY384_000857 [Bacidia gigantensis]KAG8534015.1 hypothetical protein KY384_000857 [Bacidia gigantensis]